MSSGLQERAAATTRRATLNELLDFTGDAMAGRAAIGTRVWVDVLLTLAAQRQSQAGARRGRRRWLTATGVRAELDDTHDLAVLHAGASDPGCIIAAELRSRRRNC
jgi:hypothetical protein